MVWLLTHRYTIYFPHSYFDNIILLEQFSRKSKNIVVSPVRLCFLNFSHVRSCHVFTVWGKSFSKYFWVGNLRNIQALISTITLCRCSIIWFWFPFNNCIELILVGLSHNAKIGWHSLSSIVRYGYSYLECQRFIWSKVLKSKRKTTGFINHGYMRSAHSTDIHKDFYIHDRRYITQIIWKKHKTQA